MKNFSLLALCLALSPLAVSADTNCLANLKALETAVKYHNIAAVNVSNVSLLGLDRFETMSDQFTGSVGKLVSSQSTKYMANIVREEIANTLSAKNEVRQAAEQVSEKMLGLKKCLASSSTVDSPSTDVPPQLFCYEKNNRSVLHSISDTDGVTGLRKCDDALNLLSIYSGDYQLCYKGDANKVRSALKKMPIDYKYYGNQYRVVDVLSAKDTFGESTVLFQTKDFDESGKEVLIDLIGNIIKCPKTN